MRVALLALALIGVTFPRDQADDTARRPHIVISTQRFDLPRRGVVVATITARCDACAWDTDGREAVMLAVHLDGSYSHHLPLVRSGPADYPVLAGPTDAGRHSITITIDIEGTAHGLRRGDAATIERVAIAPVLEGDAEYTAVSLAPIIHARPNTIGRFTDVPVFMWYEAEPTPRGVRYRYSVIFTNEDGGTPADRLMATWGRTTDIEYLYSVEVDSAGAILADDYQGPNHEVLPFRGRRIGRHPLLWVVTDNNMVSDTGITTIRYVPAPVRFALTEISREAVMDANPWLYIVMAQELARERKIVDDAAPGNGTIPDPRRFVYVEACGEVGHAALAFAVRVGRTEVPRYENQPAWISSDRGVREYRIVRDGCFRAAIPLPASAGARDIRTLRALAFERSAGDAPKRPPGTVRLTRINKVFMLDDRFLPGRSLLQWQGQVTIHAGGPPFELPIP